MTDLTAITTPVGLLDDDTRGALQLHGGPYQRFIGHGEWREEEPQWISTHTYRVKPQPKKPREWWLVEGFCFDSKTAAEEYASACGESWQIVRVREVLE